MSVWHGENITLELYGSSHGPLVGMRFMNVPAGKKIDASELEKFLDRRKPGKAPLTSARKEADEPEFLKGLDADGVTTGETIEAIIRNTDERSADYDRYHDTPRPGHADYTAFVKYFGQADMKGGGQFSGRMTAPLSIAGGIAKQILAEEGIGINAEIASIGGIGKDPVKMREAVEKAASEGDSIGGVISCTIENLFPGVGGPLFEGLEGRVASIVFAIPGVKGVEFGEGFRAATLKGSENNDAFVMTEDGIRTKTNHAGGILGGISDGMPVVFNVAVKPTPSIAKTQETVHLSTGESAEISVTGRHDPSIVFRAVPVVEAAAAIALLDAWITRQREFHEAGLKTQITAVSGTCGKDEGDHGLPGFRAEINEIDAKIASLFSARMDLSALIAKYKEEHGLPIFDAAREREVIQSLSDQIPEEYREDLGRLYERIFELSRDLQRRKNSGS